MSPAMTESNATPLSPFYYRDNYQRLCDTVEAQYGDILGDDERALLQVFRALTFNAQCLYVRLISRTGPWFRESKLAYAELGSVTPLVDELLANGMAVTATALDRAGTGQAVYARRTTTNVRLAGAHKARGQTGTAVGD
jgi:hypothetical protein